MTERVKLTIRLTEDAHDGFVRACVASGVSLTALLEAIGCDLHKSHRLLVRGADLIDEARRIDQENRTRR